MRVLIYFTGNARAVDQQSVMEMLIKKGHEVFLLTHLPKADLHKNVEKYGVKTFAVGLNKNNGYFAYIKHTRYLISFIRKNKIDVVIAHLQTAGLIASMARWFTKFKLFYVRHNTNEHLIQGNKNAVIVNRLTNRIAPVIIAPSEKVYQYLTKVEKLNPNKIIRINYGYNFSQYLETDRTGNAAAIRKDYPAEMLIISVARLIPAKRHLLMFEVIHQLEKREYNVSLVCLGDGYFKKELEAFIKDNNLTDRIFLPGSKRNVFDYLEAADIFLHLSETEASNSAVKEAGYCKKPVIVCNEVGDFDDYIENGKNGYIVSRANPVPETVDHLSFLYDHPDKIKELGNTLFTTITDQFSIEKVSGLYDKILNG